MEESAKDLELMDQAIKKLLAEKRNKGTSGDDGLLQDDHDQLLLSKLLSELESLKGDGAKLEQSELSPGTENEEVNSSAIGEVVSKREKDGHVDGGSSENTAAEEIVKELRKVRRQNFVTHCLLSAMIVLTVAWQVSEVSLILKVRDGLSHPFKSFGGSMLTWILKGPQANGQDSEKKQSEVVSVKIPELPQIDLGSNGEKHS